LVIDSAILIPFAIALLGIGSQVTSPVALIVLHIAASLFGVAYSVLLHGIYGQTIGKMATRIRVVDLDERAIGIRHAIWRDSPAIILSIATVAFGIRAIVTGHNPFVLADPNALPHFALVFANLIWILAEFITMLTNKRRRAIHDWIAGTLVIRTNPRPNGLASTTAIAAQTCG